MGLPFLPERAVWARSPEGEVSRLTIRVAGVRPWERAADWFVVEIVVDPLLKAPLSDICTAWQDEFDMTLSLMQLTEACLLGYEAAGWTFFDDEACEVRYELRPWLSDGGNKDLEPPP